MIILRQSIAKRMYLFDDAIRKASNERCAQIMFRDKERWLCENDLFHLAVATNQNKIAQWWNFYRPFCDEVSLMTWRVRMLGIQTVKEEYKNIDSDDLRTPLKIEEVSDDPEKDLAFFKRLYLCYRAFYKTTVITKLHSVQLLLNFPNIHFVLCHNKEENASDNLKAVKNMLLSDRISHYFPECVPKGKEWGNSTGFSLKNRSDWGTRTEDSVEAKGVDTKLAGPHWMVAKKNDLVTEQSVLTRDQIEKTAKWDELFNLGNFDSPNVPLQDYEGTRYHYADLYSNLKNDPKIKLIEVPILQEDGSITHPERFDYESIEDLKKNMWVYNCQLMLKPEDPAKMQFKKEMITYFDSVHKDCAFYLLVDPASARKKRSDFTTMQIVGVIKIGGKVLKYVVDGVRDKFDPKQRVDTALDLVVKWKVRKVGWEGIGFQDTDCFYFEEERRRRGVRVSVVEIKSHAVAKEDRIRGLVPEYCNQEWLWPEKGKVVKKRKYDGDTYDLTVEMEYELLQFPLSEHDDCLDGQTFLNRLDISKPVPKEPEEEDQGMTWREYHKICDEKLKKNFWKIPRRSYV